MKIISKDLRDGEKLPERHVFNGMGYQGDNISPHLAWDDVPAEPKALLSPAMTGCPYRLRVVALDSGEPACGYARSAARFRL